jgi:hypothetical protein
VRPVRKPDPNAKIVLFRMFLLLSESKTSKWC